MSESEAVCTAFTVVGYAFGAATLRMILFEVFPRVPESFWSNVYWFVAGTVFALVLRKIRQFWRD